MAALTYTDLADRLRALPPSCGPVRLVVIDGPAGSGKTTFALRLASAAGARLVRSDDFPVPWDQPISDWFAPLHDQVLTPLARGTSGAYHRYDWTRDTYTELIEVPPAPLLILEGVSTARRSIAHLIAFTIWIEAPRDLRLRRVLARDGDALRPQWHTWMRAEDAWFAADATRSRADLHLDGSTITDTAPLPVIN
jgi:uridine kinase